MSRCRVDEFVGREADLDRIYKHISAATGDSMLSLLAAPRSGVSELMRQVYDRLFRAGSGPIPFYFEINGSDRTIRDLANRFLREFLLQTVAFRRRDAGIIASSPDICEITELAAPADGYWVDRLAETCEMRLSDDRSFVRNCLSAPVRAARHGAASVVMVDGLHRLGLAAGGSALIDELVEIYSGAGIRSVLAGNRRFIYERLSCPSLPVEPLSFEASCELIEKLSHRTGVAIKDHTRDLIAVELGGVPEHVYRLFGAAADVDADLETFESVQHIYTDEIFGGRISLSYDRILSEILHDDDACSRVVRVLNEASEQPDSRVPLTYFRKHAQISAAALDELHHNEIVDAEALSVRFETTNIALTDYVRGRARLEVGEPRARVVGESLAAAVKRAPAIMAREYRREAALGVAELLESFDGQMVSLALFDYGRYKAEFKGAGDEKVVKALREDNAKAALPRIIYATTTESLYPNLALIADAERSAVGIGFEGDGREIAVLAAEIDSKLEATRDVAEFWCDRLEAAAVESNFANFKIWLIAPEGFDADAIRMLRDRGFYGSSRKQAALLASFLNAEVRPEPRPIPPEPEVPAAVEPEPVLVPQPVPEPEPFPEQPPSPEPEAVEAAEPEPQPSPALDEYEMTVPMGDDTEIIAARSVEDIARRHRVPQKTINQIKTALVEACINASEHSLSPDRKIHLKFTVEPGCIRITVANRGIRLADKPRSHAEDSVRRGWGLRLMQGLMDEVRIEPVDDGTCIVMSKTFTPE